MVMESDFFTGREAVLRLRLKSFEIVKPVQRGLQPYTDVGVVLPPPDVGKAADLIRLLSEEIDTIEKKYPGIRNISIYEWRHLNHERQIDANGNPITIHFPFWLNSTIIEDYWTKKAQLERSQTVLKKYPNLPSWKGYEVPRIHRKRERDMNMLLNAFYKRKDVLEFEIWKEQEVTERFPESDDIKWTESQKPSSIDEAVGLSDKKPIIDTRKETTLAGSQYQGTPKPGYFGEIGKKGGKKSKIKQPILEAVKAYIKEKPKNHNLSNKQIADKFCHKYNDKNPNVVTVDEMMWEIFCSGEHIFCRISESYSKKPINVDISITYNTLLNSYIPKAKKAISNANSN